MNRWSLAWFHTITKNVFQNLVSRLYTITKFILELGVAAPYLYFEACCIGSISSQNCILELCGVALYHHKTIPKLDSISSKIVFRSLVSQFHTITKLCFGTWWRSSISSQNCVLEFGGAVPYHKIVFRNLVARFRTIPKLYFRAWWRDSIQSQNCISNFGVAASYHHKIVFHSLVARLHTIAKLYFEARHRGSIPSKSVL